MIELVVFEILKGQLRFARIMLVSCSIDFARVHGPLEPHNGGVLSLLVEEKISFRIKRSNNTRLSFYL